MTKLLVPRSLDGRWRKILRRFFIFFSPNPICTFAAILTGPVMFLTIPLL